MHTKQNSKTNQKITLSRLLGRLGLSSIIVVSPLPDSTLSIGKSNAQATMWDPEWIGMPNKATDVNDADQSADYGNRLLLILTIKSVTQTFHLHRDAAISESVAQSSLPQPGTPRFNGREVPRSGTGMENYFCQCIKTNTIKGEYYHA